MEFGRVRPFSDVAGRHFVRLDDSPETRKDLAERLKTAGCAVDQSGSDWLSAGDLTPPEEPGGGQPLGRRLPQSRQARRVQIDLVYHDGSNSGRLQIINRGTEELFEVNLQMPEEAGGFHLMSSELPLARLPAGKSASLIAMRSWGHGKNHFDVRVTGRTADGQPYEDDVFLSTRG